MDKAVFTLSLEKSASVLFILKILEICLQKQKHLDAEERVVYPVPLAKQCSTAKRAIQSLLTAVLIPDLDVRENILKFILEQYCDKFSYKSLLRVNGFFEILLSLMMLPGTSTILKIILRIYNCQADDNPENLVRAFTSFDFQEFGKQETQKVVSLFPVVKFFPKHFVWKLINLGENEFQKIFLSDSFQTPQLIWNNRMRE